MGKGILKLHMIRILMMGVLCKDSVYMSLHIMAHHTIPTIKCAAHINTIHMDIYHAIHMLPFITKLCFMGYSQNSSRGLI
jgi:hypothetical protein